MRSDFLHSSRKSILEQILAVLPVYPFPDAIVKEKRLDGNEVYKHKR